MTDKLKIGMIGAGRWAGMAHLPGFTRSPLSEVVAICDLNRELAESRAEEFNIDGVYTDYQEMIRKEELDVVDVCTGGGPDNHEKLYHMGYEDARTAWKQAGRVVEGQG